LKSTISAESEMTPSSIRDRSGRSEIHWRGYGSRREYSELE